MENCIIYKIYQTELPDLIYIGSTNNFSRRKSNHKKNCTNRVSKKYNYPIYQYIRGCGGWSKFNMEIIDKFESDNKNSFLEKEQHYIDLLEPKLNSMRAIKKNKTNLK